MPSTCFTSPLICQTLLPALQCSDTKFCHLPTAHCPSKHFGHLSTVLPTPHCTAKDFGTSTLSCQGLWPPLHCPSGTLGISPLPSPHLTHRSAQATCLASSITRLRQPPPRSGYRSCPTTAGLKKCRQHGKRGEQSSRAGAQSARARGRAWCSRVPVERDPAPPRVWQRSHPPPPLR